MKQSKQEINKLFETYKTVTETLAVTQNNRNSRNDKIEKLVKIRVRTLQMKKWLRKRLHSSNWNNSQKK